MLAFAVVFVAFLVAIWAPTGIFIHLIDKGKEIGKRRGTWKLIAILGCIALICAANDLHAYTARPMSVWIFSTYFIFLGWAFYLVVMGVIFGIMPLPNIAARD